MEKANIITIVNMVTCTRQDFTSKEAAVKIMQALGLTRARAREFATFAAQGQATEFTVESGTGYSVQPFVAVDDIMASIEASAEVRDNRAANDPATDAAPRKEQVTDAKRGARPARLVSALFARAGIAA